MRTTIDLPDELLAEAKQQAAAKRCRLSDIVTEALRRQLAGPQAAPANATPFVIEPVDLGPPAPDIDLSDPAFYKNALLEDDLCAYGVVCPRCNEQREASA